MRKDSDVIIFIPGTLLCQVEGFVLFYSSDTGDYVTPCTIPATCIVSARRRHDGDIEHENPESLHRSALNEYPAEYWLAMGRCQSTYALLRRCRRRTQSHRRRGSLRRRRRRPADQRIL